MEAKFFLLIIFGSIAVDSRQSFHKRIETLFRQGRNLYQFTDMINCATGNSVIDYIDYGCYCGYGGTGTPVDELDRCCQVHDACYGRIQNHPDLCTFSIFSTVYSKTYTRDGCTGCADPVGTCERAICECDGEAARCFAQAEWNEAHFAYQGQC